MKIKKKKYKIQLFSSLENDGMAFTNLTIVRDMFGIYSINTNFYIKDNDDDEEIGTECNYYQDNILANKISFYISSVAYTLVHEHLPTQADITNILIRFDKAVKSTKTTEELIEALKSDGFQSDTVYFVTKETDEEGKICYVHNDLKEPKFDTGNSIADRILDNVYTDLNEKLKTLKKETPTEEEKEYIIKVGGKDETN